MSRTTSSTDASTESKGSVRLTRKMLAAAATGKVNILRGVDMDAIWRLLEDCEVAHLDDGMPLLQMNQENRTMYLVLSGQLKVYLDDKRLKEVAQLEPGQTVGELSVIDASKVSAMVCAASKTTVLCVDEDTFWHLIRSSHEFCANLLLLLSARMRNNIYSLVESEKLQSKFERESVTDGLTGVYNRRWLEQKMERLLQRSQMANRDLSVLMLDVDHFKRFNDTYGHQAGDIVLSRTASCLSKRLRAQDLVVRYGGEEFCILLPETSLAEAEITASHLLNAISDMTLTSIDNVPLPPITVSIGVACCTGDENSTSLLQRADKALYQAKEHGRNCVKVAG